MPPLFFEFSPAVLTGIGACAAGIGSFLSGYAALKTARKKATEEAGQAAVVATVAAGAVASEKLADDGS